MQRRQYHLETETFYREYAFIKNCGEVHSNQEPYDYYVSMLLTGSSSRLQIGAIWVALPRIALNNN